MRTIEIDAAYSEKHDITFILEHVYIDDEIVSTEVKGFYYGEPTEENTARFNDGDLKAIFN